MIVIASLLHDIGKFYQRTGIWIDITDFKKYLVYSKGKYQYYHAAYTGSFISQYLKNESLSSLAASHHLKKSSIVKKADIIAATHDRRDSDYGDNDSEDYILKRLSSIFHLIGDSRKTHILPLQELSKFTGFTPDVKKSFKIAKSEYNNLFKGFETRFKLISDKPIIIFYHYLYACLKEYLISIPANTFNVECSYVSLFDHLKLTAAVANVLDKSKSKKHFVIIKYQLNNIIDFVYQDDDLDLIYGRSIYINLLGDFIIYAILNEFGLGYENIMYSLGGQGRILVPNNLSLIPKLQRIYDKIYNKVNISHQGIIHFVLSYDIYDDINFKQGKFKRNLRENEKFVLKSKISVEKEIKNINYYSIGKKIINNNVIIEYNFGKKNHNINDVYFESLGSITINPNDIDGNCYYQSINSNIIGEEKTYQVVRNYQIDDNSVIVLMDLINTSEIITEKIKNPSQSFSTFYTLSRTLELFFSRIVPNICKCYDVNLIYTSGDDIVLITSIENVEKITTEIKYSFNNYTKNKEFKWKIEIEKINKSIYQGYQYIKNK